MQPQKIRILLRLSPLLTVSAMQAHSALIAHGLPPS
jgi:hypothetical protein